MVPVTSNGERSGHVRQPPERRGESAAANPDAELRAVMISKAMVVGSYQAKAQAMAAHGVDLTVIAPERWIDSGRSIALEHAAFTGYRLEACPIALPGHFHTHWYRGLGERLRRLAPRVVHVDEEPYNLATVLALRDAARVGARTCFFAWQNLDRRMPPPLGWFEQLAFRRSNGAIAGTESAARVLRRRGYTGHLWVIPQFGVDESRFSPSGVSAESTENALRPFTVGYVGRLVPEKGVDTLIAALSGWNRDWRLIVVGDGPERDRLESLAAAAGVQDRAAFRGWLTSDELPALYRSLDVLVLPSRTTRRWAEQFGRVLIEAMACEVPCVGTRCGEIPEVVGEAGVVIPENDPAALRAALAELLARPDERIRLGRLGRARVLQQFTNEQVALRTVEVYRALSGG